MNSLPQEIVEHIIDYACCDKFILVSEEPVECIEYEWEREVIMIEEGRSVRPVLSRYKWVPFWTEYSRERHQSL